MAQQDNLGRVQRPALTGGVTSGMNTAGLQAFRKRLDFFVNKVIPQYHVQLQRKVIIKFFDLVSYRNSEMTHHPRDTGFAQTNWRVDIHGRPPSNTVGAKIEGATNYRRNIAWQLDHLKPYHRVVVFNNVDYMPELERGTSKAAPLGIVGPALVDLRQWLRSSAVRGAGTP